MTELIVVPESKPIELVERESESKLISINLICRLCANPNDKFIGIFGEHGVGLNGLANKINLYLPIKVEEDDGLPSQCCWQCASTVLAWHDLVISSAEADRRLRGFEVTQAAKEFEDEDEQPDCPELATVEDVLDEVSKESIRSEPVNAFCSNNDPLSIKHYITPKAEEESEAYVVEAEINEASTTSAPDGYNFGCQFCSLMFVSESDIVKHIQESHPDQPDALPNVTALFLQEQDRSKKDKRKNNKIDQDLVNAAKVVVDGRVYYNCKECGKSLHSPYTYVWHMRIHTGERPYVCDLCGKQFRVSQGLVRHLKETHERIKNFGCDLCGRMFATRRNVEEHRRIHTNERPYICDLCGKAFKQKASLFVHNRSHSDQFPFKCTYCPQVFRTKPPMLIHITRHTGEKPYGCDVCGRTFRIKYELKRHRLIHSDEKPFSCTECGLTFRQKRYLKNHNKLNHK